MENHLFVQMIKLIVKLLKVKNKIILLMELILNQILIKNINQKREFTEFDLAINVPNKKQEIKKLKYL